MIEDNNINLVARQEITSQQQHLRKFQTDAGVKGFFERVHR
jgi:hypothetical protein